MSDIKLVIDRLGEIVPDTWREEALVMLDELGDVPALEVIEERQDDIDLLLARFNQNAAADAAKRLAGLGAKASPVPPQGF